MPPTLNDVLNPPDSPAGCVPAGDGDADGAGCPAMIADAPCRARPDAGEYRIWAVSGRVARPANRTNSAPANTKIHRRTRVRRDRRRTTTRASFAQSTHIRLAAARRSALALAQCTQNVSNEPVGI